MAASPPFAARAATITGSPIDASISLLQHQTRDVISFAMGCPARDSLPAAIIARLAADVLSGDAESLNYGPTEGEREFRRALLRFLPDHLGETVDPGELLVTSGGMQGLDLVAKLFIDPGDWVVVEEPVYANTAAVVKSYQGNLLPVPIDADGMNVDLIPEIARRNGVRPKLINVIPNFQNPTGQTLSLARRQRLLAIAGELGAVVLEDDPYGLLDFRGRRLPSLRALSGNASNVISVQTFSKILAPGLRVGWIAAGPAIIAKMVDARQAMDTCTNVPAQRIVARFIEDGFDAHLQRLRAAYALRRDAMIAALEDELGNRADVRWSMPEGGFFLWLTLPAAVDCGALFEQALAAGVAYVPGSAFSNTNACRNAIRLCFAYPDPDDIRLGVQRLSQVLEGGMP